MISRKGIAVKVKIKRCNMEEMKLISKCNFCGETKEVIPFKKSDKLICADCLIDLHDRIEGHFLPATKNDNVKDNRPCQLNAIAVIET
jgi:hypothetical protein